MYYWLCYYGNITGILVSYSCTIYLLRTFVKWIWLYMETFQITKTSKFRLLDLIIDSWFINWLQLYTSLPDEGDEESRGNLLIKFAQESVI